MTENIKIAMQAINKWYYYAIPLGMVGIVYYVFKVLLRISLP